MKNGAKKRGSQNNPSQSREPKSALEHQIELSLAISPRQEVDIGPLVQYTEAFPRREMTLENILRDNARKFPNRTAIVCEEVRYTFKEFNDRVNSLANALIDIGFRKGDWIAVVADNCCQILEMFWVGVKIGIATSIINPASSERDLLHLIGNGGARGIVFSENYHSLVKSLRPRLESVKTYITIGEPVAGFRSYEALVSAYPSSEPEVESNDNDLLFLSNTSGTTGLPKQAMHTCKSLRTMALIGLHAHGYDMREGGVGLLGAPLSWGNWIPLFSIPCYYMGCTVVIPRDLAPETLLQLIEKETVTDLGTGATFLHGLINCPDLHKHNYSSLRRVFTFGYLPPDVWCQAIELFGNIFLIGYGLTEKPMISYLSPKDLMVQDPSKKMKRLSSCGKEHIGVEVRVIDDEGNDVQAGQVGEVIAKGDDMMKGYLNAPKATDEIIRGGYLYTGDLGTVDEEGYIYLRGRKKDAITTQGTVILPSEIEEVISRHPQVLEVAVIGVPDEKLGEAIVAAVVRRGEKVTEAEVIAACRQSLPSYAIPKSVAFVQSLPKTPSGKIQRPKVRQEYMQLRDNT